MSPFLILLALAVMVVGYLIIFKMFFASKRLPLTPLRESHTALAPAADFVQPDREADDPVSHVLTKDDIAHQQYIDDKTQLEAELEQLRIDFQPVLAAAKAEAYTWVPHIEVIEYPIGVFLKYEDLEVPARYIESIAIEHIVDRDSDGWVHKDCLSYSSKPYYSQLTIVPPMIGSATIAITMNTGTINRITCTHYQAAILLDALRTAWKNCAA